ncbi:eukaryotic aspartyl protease (macronuclear) [Tetrahymena thermophila SB210]|uniref:Eukaryotic aspartyl protease n=1 Tax=Tetrahymena thermophila (strain SB210) TaxID=312017 RepID=Q234A9_TETTS|nr:eukaryotic aspartyl protease [Tetrahymena thermophila SB210]EAR92094.2 eukaryotic aspartyl protease [Tetrahymena thermophila SB210]|eukprot:XP_001012339.2 eukaryotic aspartyl protease [Tetrahymena thermophila SB210]
MISCLNILLLFFTVFCQANLIKVPLRRETQSQNQNFLSGIFNSHLDQNIVSSYAYNNQTLQHAKLKNNDKQLYTGQILLGQQKKSFTLAIDTSSDKIMIPSKFCLDQNNCKGFKDSYDCQISDGCSVTNSKDTLNYLNGYVSGTYVDALVCFGDLQNVNQKILLFDSTNKFQSEYSNGILGLGVQNNLNEQSNSFVSSLYKLGLIKENMFSLYLGYKYQDSELILGGYDLKNIVQNARISNHKLAQVTNQNSQKWAINVDKFELNTFKFTYNSTKQVALIDSSFPFIAIDQYMYEQLYRFLLLKGAYLSNNELRIDCKTNIGSMLFYMQDSGQVQREYDLPFSFYTSNSTFDCKILIQPFSSNDNVAFVLGGPFLRRFVSIYSYQNQTISFAQSTADPQDDFPVWAIIVIVVVVVIIIIAVIGIYLFKKFKSRRNHGCIHQPFASTTSAY